MKRLLLSIALISSFSSFSAFASGCEDSVLEYLTDANSPIMKEYNSAMEQVAQAGQLPTSDSVAAKKMRKIMSDMEALAKSSCSSNQ